MSRTRSFRRDVRNKTIARKKRICRAIYDASIRGFETLEHGTSMMDSTVKANTV